MLFVIFHFQGSQNIQHPSEQQRHHKGRRLWPGQRVRVPPQELHGGGRHALVPRPGALARPEVVLDAHRRVVRRLHLWRAHPHVPPVPRRERPGPVAQDIQVAGDSERENLAGLQKAPHNPEGEFEERGISYMTFTRTEGLKKYPKFMEIGLYWRGLKMQKIGKNHIHMYMKVSKCNLNSTQIS